MSEIWPYADKQAKYDLSITLCRVQNTRASCVVVYLHSKQWIRPIGTIWQIWLWSALMITLWS